MNTVRDVLKGKGNQVWSVSAGASVYDALKVMAEKGIGALVVLDGENVVGIVSERDHAREVDLKGRTARETAVGDIMTRKVIYVRPENTVGECMALMTHKHIRHLPVMEENRLVGLVSIGDIVKAVVSEQQFMIQQLENYITGGMG